MEFNNYISQWSAEIKAVELYAQTGRVAERFKHLYRLTEFEQQPHELKALAKRLRQNGASVYNKEVHKEHYKMFVDYLNEQGNFGGHLGTLSNWISTAQLQQTRLMLEESWYRGNCPTIKVYPDYVRMFSDVELDFPIAEVRFPFDATSISFPRSEVYVDMLPNGAMVPTSVLVGYRSVSRKNVNVGVIPHRFTDNEGPFANYRFMITAMIAGNGNLDSDIRDQIYFPDDGQHLEKTMFFVNMLFDGSFVDNGKVVWVPPGSVERIHNVVLSMPMKHDTTIDEGINRGYSQSATSVEQGGNSGDVERFLRERDRYDQSVKLVLRTTISTMMLSVNQHPAVERDIRNADYPRYQQLRERPGSEAEQEELAKVSDRKRGNVGYALGRSDYVLGRPSWKVDHDATHDESGRELKYQHRRKAHFVSVRYGKGKLLVRRRFQPMTIVRPDLPINPSARNRSYRTEHTT